MSTKRHFFIAYLMATSNGVAVNHFNTVSAKNTRPITAIDLSQFQNAAAKELEAEQIQFDNIVVQNIIYLGEFTDAEFFGNTEAMQASAEESIQAGVADSLSDENQSAPEADTTH